MQIRFLVSLLVSGVVHAGVFVVGSGMYDRFIAGVTSMERPAAISVSIDIVTVVRDSVEAPPVERATRDARQSYTKQSPNHSSSAGGDKPTPTPRVEEHTAPDGSETADANKRPMDNAATARLASEPQRDKALHEATAANEGDSRETGSFSSALSREPLVGQDSNKGRTNEAERTYLAEFLSELSRYKHYPRSARLREQEGRVVVDLVLEKDGTITDVKVARASGYLVLNRAALRSVQRMDRFKPFPSDLERKSWRLSIPFQYAIKPH